MKNDKKSNQNNKAWSVQITSGENARRVSLNLTIIESGINDEFRKTQVVQIEVFLT